MDNSRLAWSAPKSAVWVCAGGAVALGVAALFASDIPGRLLAGLGALVLLGIAVNAGMRRPRLSVTDSPSLGLLVHGLASETFYPAARITRIRVHSMARLGRRMPLLEIDVIGESGDDVLLIFSRWEVGTHPGDVYEALISAGFRPN